MAATPLTSSFDHAAPCAVSAPSVTVSDWQRALPVLCGPHVTLRDVRRSDAPALLRLLTTEEVTRFVAPPPTTLEGFEQFIEWVHGQRAAGQYICYAVVPRGGTTAIGLIQVKQLAGSFETAEWGFVFGQPFWGTGLFIEAATLVLAFTFDTLGTRRLEARVVVENGRGNGALHKLGGRCETVLRHAFSRHGQRWHQFLWSILPGDWLRAKAVWTTNPPDMRVH
jgi:RimJ/RimL family protein N-acetyltransferase